MAVLITGASGYIGGELLVQLAEHGISSQTSIYAAIRNKDLHPAARKLGAKPVDLDLGDPEAVRRFVVDHQIKVFVELVDAFGTHIALPAIEGLAQAGQKRTIISSGGAKFFADFSGFDITSQLADDDADLAERQREAGVRASWDLGPKGTDSYDTIFSASEASGVHAHVVIPPVVYGISRTFGNPLSRQIVDAVQVALTLGKVARPPPEPRSKDLPQTYALCHVEDCAAVYRLLIEKALGDEPADSGFYFTENGVLNWDELYRRTLAGLGLNTPIMDATEAELAQMAQVLKWEKDLLRVRFAGRNNIRGNRARKLGWTPKYDVEHLYNTAAADAATIAANIKARQS